MEILFTKDTISNAANELWQYGKTFAVWAFYAPMGAGKTTFIHALCIDVLQVEDTVSSPTFAIINEYKSRVAGTVYHMDWYRLKGEEDAMNAGVEDGLISGSLCLVEWPEIAPRLLPDNTLRIDINVVNETMRLLTVTN